MAISPEFVKRLSPEFVFAKIHKVQVDLSIYLYQSVPSKKIIAVYRAFFKTPTVQVFWQLITDNPIRPIRARLNICRNLICTGMKVFLFSRVCLCNMLGNPFYAAPSVDKMTVSTYFGPCSDSDGCTLAEAADQAGANVQHNQFWSWNGAGYTIAGPGESFAPWAGYWKSYAVGCLLAFKNAASLDGDFAAIVC